MNDLQVKFNDLRTSLTNYYAERDTEVTLGIQALLSREHFLQIGPPGTAKTMVSHDLALAFGVRYWRKLFGKHTTPEEVFGPYDLRQIKEGKMTRVPTRMAQEAEIHHWDEIFKSSSAIRNDLLTVMNERLYDHGSDFYKVPLLTVFAASNELPTDSEESEAFFDRFLIRRFVTYIRDPGQFVRMLRLQERVQQPFVSETELRTAQEETMEIRIPQIIEESILDLRAALDIEHGVLVSDRRWKQSLKLLQTTAWMQGRDIVEESDLSVLQHVLWQNPQDIKPVLRAILKMSNPVEQKVVDILDQLEEIEAQLRDEVKKAQADNTVEGRHELREQAIEWWTKIEGLMNHGGLSRGSKHLPPLSHQFLVVGAGERLRAFCW